MIQQTPEYAQSQSLVDQNQWQYRHEYITHNHQKHALEQRLLADL